MVLKGAFFMPASLVLPGLLVVIAAISGKPGRREGVLLLAVGALAGWWVVSALTNGEMVSAAPFLGSLVGLAAAAHLASRAEAEERSQIGRVLVATALVVALSGLAGSIMHRPQLALESVGLWRLAGTITYSNAAGALLAMAIPMSSWIESRRAGDLATYALVAGLAATLSRGALVAFVIALPLFARSLFSARAAPVLMGSLAGAVAVATAGREGVQPALGIALVAGAAVTLVLGYPALRRRLWMGVIVLVLLAIPLLVWQGGLVDAVRTRLGGASVETRFQEWEAALDQFGSSPLTGVGAERSLVLPSEAGPLIARFAHNEYLQIAASAGLIGVALLALVMISVIRLVRGWRRDDLLARSAVAALVVFALAASLDFVWHIPAIAMFAGWCVGLAAKERENEEATTERAFLLR